MSPINKANYLEEDELERITDFYEPGSNIAIFMHDAPDPDVCAMALMNYNVAMRSKVKNCEILYTRDNENYQNKHLFAENDLAETFMRTDEITNDPDITCLEDYVASFDKAIFIDTANPASQISVYKKIPSDIPALMIDHHKQDESFSREGYLDKIVRKCGAGVSIMLDYFRQMDYDIEEDEMHRIRKVAYLGLKTDTGEFDEDKMTNIDRSSLDFLINALNRNKEEIEEGKNGGSVDQTEEADWDTIKKIENVTITDKIRKGYGAVLDMMERLPKGLVFSYLPRVTDDSASIPYYADRLFYKEDWNDENKPSAAVVCGVVKNEDDNYDVVVSGRSMNFKLDLARLFRDVFFLETGDKKRIIYGGGRKTKPGIYVTGGRVPLSEDDKFLGDKPASERAKDLEKKNGKNSPTKKLVNIFKERLEDNLGTDD